MRRLFMLVMALAGLWLGACQKDKDSEEKNDPLGCYINDKYGNFSEESLATIGYPVSLSTQYGTWDNLYAFVAWGKDYKSWTEEEELLVGIMSDKPIAAGTFVNNPTGLPFVSIVHNFYEFETMNSFVSTQAAVVVESVTATHIKGTFSGTLVYSGGIGGTKTETIRNGRFDLPLSN